MYEIGRPELIKFAHRAHFRLFLVALGLYWQSHVLFINQFVIKVKHNTDVKRPTDVLSLNKK